MPLDRIQKLVELAVGSSNEHEARNAAVLACKMLREHDVVLTLPKSNPGPEQVNPKQRKPETNTPHVRTAKRRTKCFWCDRMIRAGQQVSVANRKSYHVSCAVEADSFFRGFR